MNTRIAAVFAALLVATLPMACGPGERGFECESDDQCAAGLLCITTEDFSPSAAGEEQCVEGQKLCTNPCAVDEDCAEFGEGLICVTQADVCAGACLIGSSG